MKDNKNILLNIDGNIVIESDNDILIGKCKIIEYDNINNIKMTFDFNKNVAHYYKYHLKNGNDSIPYIYRGWCLKNDNWREHSWVLLEHDNYNEIIETIDIKDKYFGYPLDNEEINKFYFDIF